MFRLRRLGASGNNFRVRKKPYISRFFFALSLGYNKISRAACGGDRSHGFSAYIVYICLHMVGFISLSFNGILGYYITFLDILSVYNIILQAISSACEAVLGVHSGYPTAVLGKHLEHSALGNEAVIIYLC